MEYLYNFTNDSLSYFIKQYKLHNWWIYNQDINKRYETIENSTYVKELIKKAEKNKISPDKHEIVSWIDNLSIIYTSLNYTYEINSKACWNLRIIGELHIPFSNCRCDIALIKDNKILLIELSYLKNMSRKEKYEQKLNQVMYYKELLSNALPKHIEIATYSFPIEPETDSKGNPELIYSHIAEKEIYKNHDSCYYLGKFIATFFQNTLQNAEEELNKYSDDYLIKIQNKTIQTT